jgi:amino acid transporter
MQPNERHFRAPWNSAALQAPTGNTLLGKVLTATASIVVLMVAFIVSFVVFAAVACLALLAGAYIWWRTRALRRHLREHPPGGRIIEGQVVGDNPARRID